MTVEGYNPVIFFVAKDRVPSPINVPFVKHYVATFPKVYRREGDATNFARRAIEEEDGIWQLPGAATVHDSTEQTHTN